MATIDHHIRLAQRLHPRLLSFFKRFPPPQLAAASHLTPPSQPSTISIAETTSPADPNSTPTTTIPTTTPPTTWPSNSTGAKHNPFLPFQNPRTGNWHGPHYSLRRQSELYRLAQDYNVLPLMPPSPKHPEVKEQKAVDRALQMHQRLGQGLLPISGKRAKGKVWERTLRGRMEERRKAMEGMPEMIKLWKERGHGRGWRKWPK